MEKGKCYVLLRGTVKGSVEQISERFLTVYNGDRLEASGGGADKGLFNQSNRFESPRILSICTVLLYCCNTRSLIHTNSQPCGSGLIFFFPGSGYVPEIRVCYGSGSVDQSYGSRSNPEKLHEK